MLVLLCTSSCGRRAVRFHEDQFPRKLSGWSLFVGQLASLTPNVGVVPYDLNSTLFSDYATKRRFVWMPPGKSAVYKQTASFAFPAGTIIAKTFSFPQNGVERLIETRLLVNTKSGWIGLPYVWNAGQTDAILDMAPDPVTIHYQHPAGESLTFDYVIPNANQCKECHENAKTMGTIGPKARHLNRDYDYPSGRENQLAHWTRIGYLKGAPEPSAAPRAAVWNKPETGSVDQRLRAYLDINCAHCHNTNGAAGTSGLFLDGSTLEAMRWGVCKVPVSAGQGSGNLIFDVVPGDPEMSILVHRMESMTPKVLMPELGRAVVHREGVALVRDWVRSVKGACPDPNPR